MRHDTDDPVAREAAEIRRVLAEHSISLVRDAGPVHDTDTVTTDQRDTSSEVEIDLTAMAPADYPRRPIRLEPVTIPTQVGVARNSARVRLAERRRAREMAAIHEIRHSRH